MFADLGNFPLRSIQVTVRILKFDFFRCKNY